jgi:hypothetical protein
MCNFTSHEPMKLVLKYTLRGFYIGIWSLLLTILVIIFMLNMDETNSSSLLIPYLHSVYKNVFISHIIPNAQFTLVTILNYFWQWALLVLLLPLVIVCMVGLMKRQAKKELTRRV